MAFKGFRFGADASTAGELVFSTGICDYVETLTDPGYAGQIIMQTFPLIGNYGVIAANCEGDCFIHGYVVREWCGAPSHYMSEGDVDAFLRARGVPGLWGVDTRQLTHLLRRHGAMNAAICDEIPADLTPLRAYRAAGAVGRVSCQTVRVLPAEGTRRFQVALLDYGCRRGVLRELRARGCQVTLYPHDTPADVLLAAEPDGIFLSGGPGDPRENPYAVKQLQKLLGRKPIFAAGLGHQLLALAAGGEAAPLPCGHRGGNHPVRELGTSQIYITRQNHGYAVTAGSLAGTAIPWFVSCNDGTCEGLLYPDLRACGVQFCPEACSGPRGSGFLLDRFVDGMGGAW